MLALAVVVAMIPAQMPTITSDLAQRTMRAFPGLKADQFAFGYLDVESGESDMYNPEVPTYPASVVKLFYLAYAMELIESKKLARNPELDRALTDMIKDSNNDATGLVLDAITGTTGGPSLSEKELKAWMLKRGAVNRWLGSLGLKNINCNQKTWNEGPYGRERQGYGPNLERRNSLTLKSTIDLMAMIQRKTLRGSPEMLTLLSRSPGSTDGQVKGYIGELAPTGAKLWSKAGWTSTVRHDVACIESAGRRRIYAVFTKSMVDNPKLLQFIAREMLRW